MSRLRRHMSWSVPVALAAVFLLIGQAFAAVSFSTVAGGRISNWSWDNGEPGIGGAADGSISAISVSDTQGTACFGTKTGPQVQVRYSRLTSSATSWPASKQLSGAYNADRGTLVTNGANVYAAWSSQVQYFNSTCTKYTFDTSQPRIDYFRRSTNDGATWGTAFKLPGQGSTFRGDYMYMAANGTNVYITTTNVSTGKIMLWVSADSGTSFGLPITIGSTTNSDTTPGQTSGACPCGYTGGFTGLPAVATNGSAIGIAYTASSGAEKIAICSTAGTGCTTKTVAASGANVNYGYSQAAGEASTSRLVFTWTTAAGAFSDVWTGGTAGSFGGAKKITSFPDANYAATACASSTGACNVGGSGAIPVLLGGTTVGIMLTECNDVGGVKCDETQTLERSREILVWYESINNGSTYPTTALIKTATGSSKNTSWMSEFGSATNIGGVPYILWAGHDDIYGAYDVEVRKCTGC